MNPWVAAALLVYAWIPQGFDQAVRAELRRQIPRELSCQALEIHPDLAQRVVALSFRGLTLASGDPHQTAIEAKAQALEAHVNLIAWIPPRIEVTSIVITAPDVRVTEGNERGADPSPNATSEPKSAAGLAVLSPTAKLHCSDGSFEYHRVRGPHDSATLRLDDITAKIDLQNSTGRAQGRLEGSGQFDLRIVANQLKPPLDLNVTLTVNQHALPTLDRFFLPSEGIRFKGLLQHGHTEVKVRGRTLLSSATVKYSGLKLSFKADARRAGTAALLLNMGAFLKVRRTLNSVKQDLRSRPPSPHSLTQRRDETVISFILRGMKEAALGQAVR